MALFTGTPVEEVTGYGTGIDQPTWQHKVDVIKRAVQLPPRTSTSPLAGSPRLVAWRLGALPASFSAAPVTVSPCSSTVLLPRLAPW